MNDRTAKLFEDNLAIKKADYARRLSKQGAASGISSDQVQGKFCSLRPCTLQMMCC